MDTTGDSGSDPRARPDLDAWADALRAAESRRQFAGRARGPRPEGLWNATLQWLVAAAAIVALATLTFTRDGWIPILSGADLGVHEFGHLVFFWAPTIWVQFAGSFMQVALPLAACAYFAHRRDSFAAIVTLAWAAESLNNVSVYVYDATRMVLPLFNDDGSGAGHDWHNILGELGLLGSTDAVAYLVRGLSVALFAAALALTVRGLLRSAPLRAPVRPPR
jgi:hypothetical protein